MILDALRIQQFKNHVDIDLSPSPKWNMLTGLNGCGKTNALDAIYLICVLKSFLHHSLESCVTYETDFFRLEAKSNDGDLITISYSKGGSRKLQLNGKSIKKVTDYIGRFPVMVIQPIDDYRLLEGSKARRTILDRAIAQINGNYLQSLLQYNRLIKQRNALLKQMRSNGSQDYLQLEVYENALLSCVRELYTGRKTLVDEMTVDLREFYKRISGGKEEPEATYRADVLPDIYLDVLRASYPVDIASGRSTRGPHLDDLTMFLNGNSLKSTGSQGQRKSFLVAVKLAIYRIMANHTSKLPLLLLDDLFDKLDNERVKNLLTILNDSRFGQIFITDKDDKHLIEIFSKLDFNYNHVKLN